MNAKSLTLGLLLIGWLLGSLLNPTLGWSAEPVSYTRDVQALLSKSGCNQGACHGNQNGKNGFKLSLRGEDPDFDYNILTQGLFARRLNLVTPSASLLLRKATGAVPHEGGQRFSTSSEAYRLLTQWIEQGTPRDSAQLPGVTRLVVQPAELVQTGTEPITLRAWAHFADGSQREVTNLAVFEPSTPTVTVSAQGVVTASQPGEVNVLVRYLSGQANVQLAFLAKRDPVPWPELKPTNFIDEHVFARLRKLQLTPSQTCTDEVFLRRAYLDTLGILPTAAEAKQFLDDTKANKRAKLIDRLLTRPEFADFWALKWSDLLRNEEKTLDRKGVMSLHQWLKQSILAGKPVNEIARDLLTGRGSTYDNPQANYYRALRDPSLRAETTAQVFLGIRLQCARCHNHPFERWTQNDYYGLSAYFARVQYHIVENQRKDRLDKHEFAGEQIVWLDRESEVLHPRTAQPVLPKLLDRKLQPEHAAADRLQLLGDWVADPQNPFFAKAQANRVWFHFFGRGLVEPNDDFRLSNPPLSAPLLEALADDFRAKGFDLRELVRVILNSQTYQRSAKPNAANREDDTGLSHALVRPMQAEQVVDALTQVLGKPVKFTGYPLGTRAGQLPGVKAGRDRETTPTAGERMLKSFGKPDRLLTCECERSDDTTLTQALQLISGEMLQKMLAEPDNTLGKLLAQNRPTDEILETLYLTTLSRRPSEAERKLLRPRLDSAANRRVALEDLVWALVNAKEFLLKQ